MSSNIHLFLRPLLIGIPSHWLFVSCSRLSPSTGLCRTRHPPTVSDYHDTPAVTGGLHPLLDIAPKNRRQSFGSHKYRVYCFGASHLYRLYTSTWWTRNTIHYMNAVERLLVGSARCLVANIMNETSGNDLNSRKSGLMSDDTHWRLAGGYSSLISRRPYATSPHFFYRRYFRCLTPYTQMRGTRIFCYS